MIPVHAAFREITAECGYPNEATIVPLRKTRTAYEHELHDGGCGLEAQVAVLDH